MAEVNFQNHVVTRLMHWIRLQLGKIAHYDHIEARRVTSWVRLSWRAAAGDSDIDVRLPQFTSLATT